MTAGSRRGPKYPSPGKGCQASYPSYGALQMTFPALSWRRRSVEGHPRPRNSWGDAYSSSFLGRVGPREPNGATKKVVAAFALIQSVECFFLELELGPPLGFPGTADGARGTLPPMCPGNLPSLAQHRIDFGSRIPFHHLTCLPSLPSPPLCVPSGAATA